MNLVHTTLRLIEARLLGKLERYVAATEANTPTRASQGVARAFATVLVSALFFAVATPSASSQIPPAKPGA